MIKILRKLGIECKYLNIVKAIYDKLIANIIVNSKKLKPFPLKSGMRKGCPLFPFLYLKDPKNSTQKLLDTVNSYSKVAGYKINLQKSLAFSIHQQQTN
jgi:hypothetical protein